MGVGGKVIQRGEWMENFASYKYLLAKSSGDTEMVNFMSQEWAGR